MFIKAYSYFFKSKWGFSLVRDQANGPHIKSSTFNYPFNLETSKLDSRSSFIAFSDCNVSWKSNQRNLLYSFNVKIHTKDCTHIYTNQYKLIICYTIRDCVILLLRKLSVHMALSLSLSLSLSSPFWAIVSFGLQICLMWLDPNKSNLFCKLGQRKFC